LVKLHVIVVFLVTGVREGEALSIRRQESLRMHSSEGVTDRKRRRWAIAGVLCIASLALFFCADSVARDAARHVQVKSGTGFFVSPGGFVVTSAHIIAGCPGITLWPADEPELIARIVGVDTTRDIALLSAAGKTEWYADRVRDGDSLHAGDPVSTIGFGVVPSRPREPRMTLGRLIGGVSDARGYPLLLIQADLRAGNSGGPVIDTNGTLLGMVTGRDAERPELGVAVPAEAIDRFLSLHGIARSPAIPPAAAPLTTPGLLKAMSVLVQCRPPA
jgi:S1-C subfamily serine protease